MMTLSQRFLQELQQEATATKEILSLVPIEKGDWKPHEKSMSLLRLASHVAELPAWVKITLIDDELDFATSPYKPYVPETTAALVAFYEKNLSEAASILEAFPDENYENGWTMRAGEQIYFTSPKGEVLRTWCLNHLVHHRAQLGVYLRMLDIPLPSTYGPTGG